MNLNKFAQEIAKREEGKKQVDIAQIKEILRIVNQIIKERTKYRDIARGFFYKFIDTL